MLVKATKKDIEKYLDFAYSLAVDQTRSGYPIFSDGISTKEQFAERVRKHFAQEGYETLLFLLDGRVEGWIQFFYIEQDHYLQTSGFLIDTHTERALEEFFGYAAEHYAGYTLYLGFPRKNARAIDFLHRSGCKLAEESFHDIFVLEDSALQPECAGLVGVTDENYSAFREVLETDEDTYWDADRIYATLGEWIIYLFYREGTAAGYVYARNGEIFGMGYRENVFDEKTYRALTAKILNDLKAAGYRHVTFFHDGKSQPAALEIGFRCVAEYVLYTKRV